jgi:hypothetical protein
MEGDVKAVRSLVVAAAFVLGGGFSSDSAGRACVKEKGERGTGYDIHKTSVNDAYAPGGRRLIENGHRVYEVVVPPLIKRDKPITCTMSLANGQWAAPGIDAVERGLSAGNGPLSGQDEPVPRGSAFNPFTARETRVPDSK